MHKTLTYYNVYILGLNICGVLVVFEILDLLSVKYDYVFVCIDWAEFLSLTSQCGRAQY